MDVSGVLIQSASVGFGGIALGTSRILVSLDFSASGFDKFLGSINERTEQMNFPTPGVNSRDTTGDLDGLASVPDRISLGTGTVATGQAYTLEFGLFARSTARLLGQATGQAKGSADFGSTMNFPTLGSVFDLPEGYTVNSASANIVDNEWLGTPVSVTAPAIPLSPALILFSSVLLPLVGFKRRARIAARSQ